ncbi:MAG: putative nuclease of putative toxin-antitoxin system [Saprospiraceae bacterium]|jgi:predicted nuclease of predicted toxin-antitoxin system
MKKYIVDVNLPYYFGLWRSEEYIHQADIDAKATDQFIWEYAKKNQLTIITKDSDFSSRMLISEPPPRVIHIKFGNMKMKDFHKLIHDNWSEILEMSNANKLVNVYKENIEGIN